MNKVHDRPTFQVPVFCGDQECIVLLNVDQRQWILNGDSRWTGLRQPEDRSLKISVSDCQSGIHFIAKGWMWRIIFISIETSRINVT